MSRYVIIVAGLVLTWGCTGVPKEHNPQGNSSFDRGVGLNRQGDLEGAIHAYREAIQRQPSFYQAHYNLGIALLQKKNYSGAASALQQAVQLKPDFASAYNNLGIAFSHQGKLDEAIVSFREAIHHSKGASNTNFHFNLGIALWRSGDLPGAKDEFQKILKIEPQHREARNALEEMLRGKTKSRITRAKA